MEIMTKRTKTLIKKIFTDHRKANTRKWKNHGEVRLNPGKSIDEIVINNCDLHIEQMSDGNWWIGIGTGRRTKPHGNRKEHMHIRLFHNQDEPVVINCETDDGLITEGYFNR